MVRVLNDFIFIREVREFMSPGGIVLPVSEQPWSASQDNPQKEGVVAAVGPGRRNKKNPQKRDTMWDIVRGMRIAFSPNGNLEQTVDGEVFTVIRRDSVIGEV